MTTLPQDSENEQPVITFAIIAYNQEKFIHEAIEAAFAQTYSPLQIILSDDHSPDRTFEIMQEMAAHYNGPHRITLNRNETNQRLAAHVNTVMSLADGEIVVLAAGDDISLPERTQRSWEILRSNPDALCVSFSTIVFQDTDVRSRLASGSTDKTVVRHTLKSLLAKDSFHINGAARSYRKSIYGKFGPLRVDSPTEDSTLLLRCLLMGAALKSAESMVLYRVHGENIYASSNKHRINYARIHDQYLADLSKARDIGLIDEETYQKVERVLSTKLKKRELRSGMFCSEHKVRYFFSEILFSGQLRIKEKIKLFKILARRSPD